MDRRRALLALALALLLLPAKAHAAAVTVREPAYGLPHFFADTDLELVRENGREIAKDRLGQLILLVRFGRGTIAQVFGAADSGFLDDDVLARREGYTSSELNLMWQKLPERDRELILEYCRGVNDTIEAIYAGQLPEPFEVSTLRFTGFGGDLFGNATLISDQLDPFYRAPGGADPERPNAGFQFTPEMAMAVAVLQVRNFGLASFNEAARLEQLQALLSQHGSESGAQIWSDLNFTNDPLAPVSVPDDRAPGFGGPLATGPSPLARYAARFPRHAYAASWNAIEAQREARAERARRFGAWPQLGSYSWAISSARSATGHPWLGGFPQTGELTPSIMHFAENRSRERIAAIGMEFVGGPFVLIGHTDSMAWTSTTAQLPVVDTFFERLILEDTDQVRYDDEGTPAPLSTRTETVRFGGLNVTPLIWRSHERGGNGGSRPVSDFLGDVRGVAEGGSAATLVDAGAFDPTYAGGHVALIDGTGAGQVRAIGSATANTLIVNVAWTTPPDASSAYVAVRPGGEIIAVARDSAAWLEESTAALGFSLLQQGHDVLDVRAAMRVIPSTHNFPSADNRTFNGHGTAAPFGNIAYYSSGFSRIRQGGEDLRLPLDGSLPNPLVRRSGTVEAAGPDSLTQTGAFAGIDLSPPAVNARYLDPDADVTEFILVITSGDGYKQTRRIAQNTNDTVTLEFSWGTLPSPGDGWEIQEILGMPEVINPAEGYTANWNNKAATRDPGSGFGREHRVSFILERLAADGAWDRVKNRMLNSDLAGLDGNGRIGRFLVPRLRQAVEAVGGDAEVLQALEELEDFESSPQFGRFFIDPVSDVAVIVDPEEGILDNLRLVPNQKLLLDLLATQLARDIFGDELASVGVPGGSRGLALVQHAIDSAQGDVVGAYAQAYAGDYFGGVAWETVLRDALIQAIAAADAVPENDRRRRVNPNQFVHLLASLPNKQSLVFPEIPDGNRGTWEQIVEVGPELRGEFIFPLGQSAHFEGELAGPIEFSDPNVDSLHPIWRDWRFVPMLPISADVARTGSADSDGDGVLDGFERWYFGDTSPRPGDDADGDGLDLAGEFASGSDPTDADTDRDGVADGVDEDPQDRLVPVPEPGSLALGVAALGGALTLARRRYAPCWSSKPAAHS